MKNLYFFGLCLLISLSCSKKKEPIIVEQTKLIEIQYDTTPLDSFSPGATNINVARNIKIASKKYQDSIIKVREIEEERKVLLEIEKAKEQAKKEANSKVDNNQEITTSDLTNP